jgi:phosphonate transport system substrate-binding protein
MIQPLRFSVSRSHGGPHPLEGALQFAEVLSARLGAQVELKQASDYDQLGEWLVGGRAHLAWMPPLSHARATAKGAVLAAVAERGGALTYRSALVVRADSMHTALAGLRNLKVAWTDPSSASGYLFARLHLLAAGVDPRRDNLEENFYGSTRAACHAVIRGEADLAACYVRDAAAADHNLAQLDLERVLPGAATQLRVLDVTDRIPPDGVVLSQRLAPEVQAMVRDVLLDLHNQPSGRAALEGLMQAERLRGVTEDVRKVLARLRAHVHVS